MIQLNKVNYAELIASLSHEERVSFYEYLAHNLTISCRSIWSNDEITTDDKVEAMKWLNEILHRIVAKIRVERLQLHEWEEQSVINMITKYVSNSPKLSAEVGCAIQASYTTFLQNNT